MTLSRRFCLLLGLPFLFISHRAAAVTVSDWIDRFSQPDTQKEILERIYPGKTGPVSEARAGKEGTMMYFPKGGMWVRLSPGFAHDAQAKPAYLIVSSSLYQHPDARPVSAVTFLIRDGEERAEALTSGYAAEETPALAKLPKLNRTFIVLMSRSFPGSPSEQRSALVMDSPSPSRRKLQPVWTSPWSLRRFQFTFDTLGQSQERLVVKNLSSTAEDPYLIYRWDGSRFTLDSFSNPKTAVAGIPESEWRFGSAP